MAVTDTTPRPAATNGNGPPQHTAGTHPPAKPGNWVQKHKALAALGGVGVAVLLLSHKGAKGSTTAGASDTTAADAAAEQAAIDQAVGAATGVNPGGSSGSSDPGLGDGTGSAGSSTDPSAVDPGTGAAAPDPTAGLTDPGSGQPAPSPIDINIGPNGTVSAPSKAKPLGKGAIAAPSGHSKPPAKKGYTTVGLGGGKWEYRPVSTAKKPTTPAKPKSGEKAPAKTAAPKAGKKPAPAPKKPAPKTVPKRKGKGSVVKFGRFFDNAQSAHVGQARTTSDGVIHEPVTVNYGGYSETHMSHNRGEGWTDNVPGYSPPSRGVPIVRLGTPTLVGADEDE